MDTYHVIYIMQYNLKKKGKTGQGAIYSIPIFISERLPRLKENIEIK